MFSKNVEKACEIFKNPSQMKEVTASLLAASVAVSKRRTY